MDTLPIAHRVWAQRLDEGAVTPATRRTTPRSEPTSVLVFDTETTTDKTQALLFGSYRFCRITPQGLVCVEEGLFYADDLPQSDPEGFGVLKRYVREHQATLGPQAGSIRLRPRREFVEQVFFKAAFKARSRVVGFNLPFDLSRIAIGVAETRGRHRGGIDLILSPGKAGTAYRERKHRPRVAIRHVNGKLAFMSLTAALHPDPVDRIPEDSPDGLPDEHYVWRGRFLDLRTLAYALTGQGYTLESACDDFGVGYAKRAVTHGTITEDYVTYCREDVAATAALYEATVAEFARHGLRIEPERAFSPASLAKAYLRSMGIVPALERQAEFPRDVLGYASCAFYGGRAECHIRRVPVPVAVLDFTASYPTVHALMDLRRYLVAQRIEAQEATKDVSELLGAVTLSGCFDPALWPRLVGFVLVAPERDVLPVRAAYDGRTWGIGVNPLTSSEPLWFTIADCVASTLLTGRPPTVLRALTLVPHGTLRGLKATSLRGSATVDPRGGDPFLTMVQERQRLIDAGADQGDGGWTAQSLKLIANAGAYGIFAEFNPQALPKGERARVGVHSRTPEPFSDRVGSPEDPGTYCFPPVASCVTGAARLMLGMLERCVVEAGGTWALCDTDSMAVVSSPSGGLVPCPGGTERNEDGAEAVRSLSYAAVEDIRSRFDALNPYDPEIVKSVLRRKAQGMCLAISAKRYALYELDDEGTITFVDDPSRHGLGHLLNPVDPDTPDTGWIADLWRSFIADVHSLKTEEPTWFARPIMMRSTVTSPAVLRAFRHLNQDKPYAQQIKPFNFLLSAAGAKPPAGIAPGEPFRLVAPWQPDPRRWTAMRWTDVHHPSEDTYRITTQWGRASQPRVDTYGDMAARYFTHPEAKALGPDGAPCSRQTVGLLDRRVVTAGAIVLIGKESNRLDERASGELSADDLDQRLVRYDDEDTWYRICLPKLRAKGARWVAAEIQISERRARDILKGRALPHRTHRIVLEGIVAEIEDSAIDDAA